MANRLNAFRFGTAGRPASTPAKPAGSIGTIRHLATQNLLALEIGWVRSVRVSEQTCLQIKQHAADSNIALSIHAPYYINLNAAPEEWPKSRKRLMDAAHYGHLAGATDVVFHPGSYFNEPQGALITAVERLSACMQELRASKNPITLRPETMGKRGQMGSLSDCLLFSQEIEGVEPCLDFAHLHARQGDGSLNSVAEWRTVMAQYRTALGENALQRLHTHLSGIAYTSGGERKHLLLRDSDLDLNALLSVLHEFNCAGRILCESPLDNDLDARFIQSSWIEICQMA